MIKGKHQYAVFNLSEGRLTYHPYWLAACSIPPSTKRLRSLWKTRGNGLPRSPPMSSPPPAWWPRPRPQMSANHQTQRPPRLAGGVGLLVLFPFCGATAMPAQRTKTWTWYKPKPISLILSLVSGWRNPIPHLKSSILGVWMTSSFTLMGSLVRSTKLLHEAVKVDLFNQLLLDISFGWLKWQWIHHEIAFLRPKGQNGLMWFYLCMHL